ncbi:MAG: ribulose-phosphate 3-epimerase [Anaerolineales bacterium]|nr:MAG: ribulose-phosphate 3-epimerase [Anaerolineales bacterium]
MKSERRVKIAASLLSADFGRLGEQVRDAEAAGVDHIHVDVMDGRFVPNIAMGPLVVKAVRRVTSLPLLSHLMIVEPDRYIPDFAAAGSDWIAVHQEASPHLHRAIQQIKSLGLKAAVALNPATPVTLVEEVLEDVEAVLVMTVNPGFGGQEFIESMLGKITQVRRMLDERGLAAEVLVDGGISAQTAPLAVAAGATVLGAGTAVFGAEGSIAEAVARLRSSIEGSPQVFDTKRKPAP